MGQWADLLGDWPADADIGYNIAPTAMVPAFTAETGRAMHWGMIPPWAKEPKLKYATFNARSESVADKPAFRHAWSRSQTCLVPALGYYEWKGPKGAKQPWFIRPAADEPLVMAGLWEHWQSGGDALYSCTIITRPSAGRLADLHSRMPMMVDHDQAERWINDGVAVFEDLMENQDVSTLVFHPVSRKVNRAGNEGAQLTEPIEPE
jgi:putative SOS response-associated peptidase YedK